MFDRCRRPVCRSGRHRMVAFAASGALLVTVSPPRTDASETISADTLALAVRLPVENAPAPGPNPSPTPPVGGPTAPSGQAMPVGDLPGWRQTFADDFTTDVPAGSFPATVSSQWAAYSDGWKDTTKFGTYSPSKVVSIAGGVLNKYIRTDNGVPLVAAIVPKVPGSSNYGITYGRFAVRFRTDSLPGYKLAWLLWPDSGNRAEGEIDWPEMNLDGDLIWAFMHRTNPTKSGDQAWFNMTADVSNWHTAVIEWSPNLVVYLLDGVEIGRTTERVPKTPLHWVLQTETELHTTAKPSATVKGNVQVDWVSVWAYAPS